MQSPDRLVTVYDAAKALKISYRRVTYLRAKKRITPVETKGSKQYFSLNDIQHAHENNCDPRKVQAPPGHITSTEAACILKFNPGTVIKKIAAGIIKGQKIHYADKQWMWFAEVESVKAFDEARKKTPEPVETVAERPLISANNGLCLDARLEMFERAGTQINFRKLLARGRGRG